MAVNVKMGVDIGGFTSGIREGQQILKGLNAEMKASEAEFKATGDAEKKMSSQTKTLNSQLNVQKGIADQARAALQKMTDAGVDPASTAYQKMYVQLMNAEAGANEAQAALNALGGTAQQAAGQADQLTESVNGIGKKISLEQVKSGIDSITSGLENAARKAVELGEKLFSTIMNSATWADDTATMAQMYGIDVERFQQMQALVAGGLDTTVESILGAQSKLKKGIGNSGKEVTSWLKELGVAMYELQDTGGGILEFVPKDADTIFWETGQALMGMSDAFDKEAAATALFGKSWKELVPLFEEYKTLEEYNAALDEQNVVSEDLVKNGAELNDTVGALSHDFETLKNDVLLSLAPALTEAAKALDGVLKTVLDYLQTEEGKQKLGELSEAVTNLFSGLSNIDTNGVVETFGSALETVTGALTWISEHWQDVETGILAIAGAFGALKIASLAIDITKLVSGLSGLLGGGGTGGGTGGGGGAVVTGGGGTTLFTGISNVLNGILPSVTSWASVNGGPVLDWLTHESPIAGVINGTESIADWFETKKAEVSKNWETFGEDWENFAPVQAMKNLGTNNAIFWDNFWSNIFTGSNGWNWNPAEGSDWTDEEAQNLTEAIKKRTEEMEAVDVNVEPKVEGNAASDIAAQVGTVTVPLTFSVGGFGLWTAEKHANGLPWVPYDGYLAMLHQGERVLTASQNRSYTYNSNNYFGNVNLNNGQDIDALCDRIDRRNKRQRSGYGA